jgi:Polyketide cyclase / dehydrase and lipid transport
VSVARARIDVPGPIAPVEELWYDLQRWPSFIDGLGHVVKTEGDWPRGGRLVWDSHPGGRGRVTERVRSFEARVGQVAEVEDERLHGTQRVHFEALEDGTSISLELDYALKRSYPGVQLVDALFIRRAVRDSLRRTLLRLSRELESDRTLLR